MAAGLIRSDMASAGMQSPAVQQASQNVILKRFGLASEVADCSLSCINVSSYITAQTINVNGGLYFNEIFAFIGAGIEAIPGFIGGAWSICNCIRCKSSSPGVKFSDDFILASTYDVESTVSISLQYHNTKRLLMGYGIADVH